MIILSSASLDVCYFCCVSKMWMQLWEMQHNVTVEISQNKKFEFALFFIIYKRNDVSHSGYFGEVVDYCIKKLWQHEKECD